jgi:hypothetical protein
MGGIRNKNKNKNCKKKGKEIVKIKIDNINFKILKKYFFYGIFISFL